MNLWHKFRNGAYFVDIILLIAAVIAMIGLATFVHLHTSKAPNEASKKSPLAYSAQHLENLSFDDGSGASNHSNRSKSTHNSSNASSQLQSAMATPENASMAVSCSMSCDNMHISASSDGTEAKSPISVQPVKSCGGLSERAVNTLNISDLGSIECLYN